MPLLLSRKLHHFVPLMFRILSLLSDWNLSYGLFLRCLAVQLLYPSWGCSWVQSIPLWWIIHQEFSLLGYSLAVLDGSPGLDKLALPLFHSWPVPLPRARAFKVYNLCACFWNSLRYGRIDLNSTLLKIGCYDGVYALSLVSGTKFPSENRLDDEGQYLDFPHRSFSPSQTSRCDVEWQTRYRRHSMI